MQETASAIQAAHAECEKSRALANRHKLYYTLYALRCGALLTQLEDAVREAGTRDFKRRSENLLAVSSDTIENYRHAWKKFCDYAVEIDTAERAPEISDDNIIDVETISETGETATVLATVPEGKCSEIVARISSVDFDVNIKEGHNARTYYSQIRRVIGDRGLTALYRRGGLVPPLKEGASGKRLLKTGPLIRAERRKRLKIRERIVADFMDADGSPEMTPQDWEVVFSGIQPIAEKHGYSITRHD